MNRPGTPAHLRRSRLAKRVQLLLAIASAAFVVYRIVTLFLQHGSPLR